VSVCMCDVRLGDLVPCEPVVAVLNLTEIMSEIQEVSIAIATLIFAKLALRP
jgi:hypothetical protein